MKQRVADIMTREVSTVFEEDNVAQVLRLLKPFRSRHVPVIDEGKTVVGILSRTDLLQLTSQGLDQSSAAILKELLTNEPALPLEIDRSAREVLTEIGNILLNACLGTFGNLLKVQVSFSVPHLELETLEGIVSSIAVGREGLRYALIVHAAFRLRNSSLTGYLVIVLGVASIERLIRALERWEGEQH